jgi:hypothetical protein
LIPEKKHGFILLLQEQIFVNKTTYFTNNLKYLKTFSLH